MQMRFGPAYTPDVIKWLLGANVAVFLLQRVLPLAELGVMEPTLFWQKLELWRAATYMWLHGGGWHLVGNMLALWMFGSDIASAWGAQRFLRFYLISGVGAGVLIALWQGLTHWLLGGMPVYTLGASGAVYAVLLAHSLLWPDRTIMLIFPPIPLRALYLIPFLLLMDLIFAPPGISHVGHLGGVLVGYLLLAQSGDTGVTLSQLQYRLKRWRMRRKLRALDNSDFRRRNHH
jgi:membrane associated rhomboid family serine protease